MQRIEKRERRVKKRGKEESKEKRPKAERGELRKKTNSRKRELEYRKEIEK